MDSENLPFPKTREGWGIAIVATILLFVLFYTSGYFILDLLYSKQVILSDATEVAPGLFLRVEIPRYVSRYTDRDLVLTVDNQTQTNIDIQVKILTYVIENNTSTSTIPSATSIQISSQDGIPEGYDSSNVIHFYQVPSNARIHRTVRFKLPGCKEAEVVRYRFLTNINGTFQLVDIRNIKSISLSTGSFISEVLKAILLPPLSNGFLPLIALFSSFSLDVKTKPDRENKGIVKYWYIAVILRSLLITIIIVYILYLYICLINKFPSFPSQYLLLVLCIYVGHLFTALSIDLTWEMSNLPNETSFKEMINKCKSTLGKSFRRYSGINVFFPRNGR